MNRFFAVVLAAVICLTAFSGCIIKVSSNIEENAMEAINILSSGDAQDINELLFGDKDMELADDPLAELLTLSTGEGVGVNVLTELIAMSTVEVLSVEDDTIKYEITAPDMSDFFEEEYTQLDSTDNEAVTDAIYDYADNADEATTKVELDYETDDDEVIIDYNKEFNNALVGGLVDGYEDHIGIDNNDGDTTTDTPDTPAEETKSIIGNGGSAISAGGYTYYIVSETDTTFVREDKDGNLTDIYYTDLPTNRIFVLNDTMYITDYSSECIVCFDFEGNQTGTIDGLSVEGVCEDTGVLLTSPIEDRDYFAAAVFYSFYNPETGATTDISGTPDFATMVGTDAETVYFSYSTDGIINLYQVDAATGSAVIISDVSWTEDMGDASIEWMQVTDKSVYFSYGGRAGSGNFFQGGEIARYDKSSTTTEIIAELDWTTGDTPYFNVFEKNGVEHLLYKDSESTAVIVNCETMETEPSSMNVGPNNKPFAVTEHASDYSSKTTSYYIYPDMTGDCVQLIPETTLDDMENISYVNYTGNKVFYQIRYSKDNPDSVAWWNDTVEYQIEYYVHDLQSGVTTKLPYTATPRER